ncbi:AIM24 family protein [Paenibacillus ginsengihumi]|uniref:AIM24 family protein n=1 Tax=Paenibacillus ginsengihumi TaxID=431596 RepID=UPI00035E3693|nr:AIM24 family protein [Paenibacillus ginsengihumi]
MKVIAPPPQGHVSISLEAEESLIVLHPKSILAYQGSAHQRQDQFMNLLSVYHKKKWISSLLQGPCDFVMGLPPGCSLTTVHIAGQEELLFDFRNIMFFSQCLTTRNVIQKMRTAWITKDLIRMRFSGEGSVGILTAGDLATLQLHPEKPIFVDKSALVAYPQSASIQLSVYGNKLASQHMNVQWQLTGRGPVLIQTGYQDAGLMNQLQDDGLLKRLLREIIPFGNVIIK